MAWETLLAAIDITIADHTYHVGIVAREGRYYIHKGQQYQEFDGKGDDKTAIVLGLTHIAQLIGREIEDIGQIKGPEREQL